MKSEKYILAKIHINQPFMQGTSVIQKSYIWAIIFCSSIFSAYTMSSDWLTSVDDVKKVAGKIIHLQGKQYTYDPYDPSVAYTFLGEDRYGYIRKKPWTTENGEISFTILMLLRRKAKGTEGIEVFSNEKLKLGKVFFETADNDRLLRIQAVIKKGNAFFAGTDKDDEKEIEELFVQAKNASQWKES